MGHIHVESYIKFVILLFNSKAHSCCSVAYEIEIIQFLVYLDGEKQ